jgi:hypothetical protein
LKFQKIGMLDALLGPEERGDGLFAQHPDRGDLECFMKISLFLMREEQISFPTFPD